MSIDIAFRKATKKDIVPIVDLVEEAYHEDGGEHGWLTQADLLDGQRTDQKAVEQLLNQSDSMVLLAEECRDLLACAHLEKRKAAGYFGMLAVRPEMQSRGIGRQVLEKAEQIVSECWQLSRMTMSVIDQRPALREWYESCGYWETGKEIAFDDACSEFGKPGRSGLRVTYLEKVF